MDSVVLLSTTEFAAEIGRSERQVRRYLKQGLVRSVETPAGVRIPATEVAGWRSQAELSATRWQASVVDPVGHVADTMADMSGRVGQGSDTGWERVSDMADTGVDTMADMSGRVGHGSDTGWARVIPIEAHLAALRLVEQAREDRLRAEEVALRSERMVQALRGELARYQLALTERAESIVEREAMAKQMEAQLEAEKSLALENEQRLKEFEETSGQLRERLRRAEGRVEWLEKRIPRWLRKALGAG